ncbi:MAG: radical SAM protein [Gammaproteobacteria bacterium]|nr:radical SAM protein [Gammaproteobacteria bacterium]
MSANATSLPYRSFQLHPTLLGESLPSALSLETTNHCNLHCTHCGHSQYAQFAKGYLEEGLFEKVAPHLGPGKIPTVNLSDFGEPFMSKRFWKIFESARAIGGLRISFITNAVLLDRHLDKLTHSGLDIAISMDGASEQTFSQFRGAGHFEKVVNNLRQLYERERAGTLPASSRTFIVVLSRINVHEMPAIVELAAELGIKLIVFSFQVFFNAERFRRESLFFSQDLYDRWIATTVKRAAELGIQVLYPTAFDGSVGIPPEVAPRSWLWRDARGRTRCGVIDSNCYVKFHGQVEACCVPDRYPLGDLNANDFLDIWHGPYYRRLRQSFLSGEWTPTCQNCNLFQSVDSNLSQSHFLTPMRDEGGLVPMPQPYRITEMETRYRNALDRLLAEPDQPASVMPQLLHLATQDDRLHEVANAIGVAWMALEQPDKGVRLLRQAARLAPEDPVAAHNLALIENAETVMTPQAASTAIRPVLGAQTTSVKEWTAPLRWVGKVVKRR